MLISDARTRMVESDMFSFSFMNWDCILSFIWISFFYGVGLSGLDSRLRGNDRNGRYGDRPYRDGASGERRDKYMKRVLYG